MRLDSYINLNIPLSIGSLENSAGIMDKEEVEVSIENDIDNQER